jgi:hypothetical protein
MPTFPFDAVRLRFEERIAGSTEYGGKDNFIDART